MSKRIGLDRLNPPELAKPVADPNSKIIDRKQATSILAHVRALLAERRAPETIEKWLETQHGIAPLQKCPGEAHSNPYIDNCAVCMPRWGWVGLRLIVK